MELFPVSEFSITITILCRQFFVDTTRPQRVLEENGKNYWFTDRESMEEDIKHHKFLEYGEYSGNFYGTHLDSIREVIKQVSDMTVDVEVFCI